MKKISVKSFLYFLALLFSGFTAFAQFELEHSYPGFVLSRQNFEAQGERYITYEPTDHNVLIYDGAHQLLKTVNTPEVIQDLIAPAYGFQVTATMFDTDPEIECYGVYINELNYTLGAIWDENGTIILSDSITTDGRNIYYSPIILSTEPYIAKLIKTTNNQLTGHQTYTVYALPSMQEELVLDNATEGNFSASFLILEDGEILLVETQLDQSQFKVYNENLELIKTISLPTLEGYTPNMYSFGDWSIHSFNSDDMIELIVRYDMPGAYQYLVINEEGDIIHQSDNPLFLSMLDGLDTKLIETNYNDNTYTFYNLPEISPEQTYSEGTYQGRNNLGINGEKYFFADSDTINIYNADHSLYKSFPIYKNENGDQPSLIQFSDDIANEDDKIEYIVSWLDNETSDRAVYVAQDNGNVLFENPEGLSCILSELAGYDNKLICYNNSEGQDTVKVYSIVNMPNGTVNITLDQSRLNVYPNPFHNELNVLITPNNDVLDVITLYDTMGKKIKDWNSTTSPSTLKDLSKLPKGSYIIEAKSGKEKFSKVVIKH